MSDRALLKLQEVDSEISRLTHRREELESAAAVRAAAEMVVGAENLLGDLRLSLDEISSRQKRMEFDDDAMGQKLEAEQKRMYDGTISNPKQLQAVEAEIKSIKERTTRLEDDLLELMEQRETLDGEIRVAETDLAKAREEHDRLAGETARDLEQVRADLETAASSRETIAAGIDEELLELYDDLRASKHGVGAAELVDGVCQGCHEQLSSMELDALKRAEGIRRCPHCRRIIV